MTKYSAAIVALSLPACCLYGIESPFLCERELFPASTGQHLLRGVITMGSARSTFPELSYLWGTYFPEGLPIFRALRFLLPAGPLPFPYISDSTSENISVSDRLSTEGKLSFFAYYIICTASESEIPSFYVHR